MRIKFGPNLVSYMWTTFGQLLQKQLTVNLANLVWLVASNKVCSLGKSGHSFYHSYRVVVPFRLPPTGYPRGSLTARRSLFLTRWKECYEIRFREVIRNDYVIILSTGTIEGNTCFINTVQQSGVGGLWGGGPPCQKVSAVFRFLMTFNGTSSYRVDCKYDISASY